MSFFGRSFIYDGKPSEEFGLLISNIDADGVNESMGSSSMEIEEQKVFRRATPYFFGATPSPKLEFELSAFSEDDIDAETFGIIQRWLFSSREYKKLQIDQPDMQQVYFNCFLQEPEIVRVGSIIKGFNCTVTCDSPFAYKFPQTTTYTYTADVVDETETYYNMSEDKGAYLHPETMVITMNNLGGDVTITNESDNDRVVSFTGLLGDEVLTISPNYQTISSSSGLKRLSASNKKFLRLVPNKNVLRIQGSVASISMTNQFVVKKIGG